MNFEIFVQTVIVIIGICGGIYGMMKFLLKDIYAQLKLMDSHITLINNNIDEIRQDHKKMDQRVTETNKRMDGVYNVLLKRTEKLNG